MLLHTLLYHWCIVASPGCCRLLQSPDARAARQPLSCTDRLLLGASGTGAGGDNYGTRVLLTPLLLARCALHHAGRGFSDHLMGSGAFCLQSCPQVYGTVHMP